jgi:hypothetical protein
MSSIKDVFAKYANIKIDEALIKRIHHFEQEFTHRNEEHIEFFGGNLLGVNKVRFLPKDWANWFDNVLNVDDVELESALHDLKTVNKNHNVASDVMNLTCIWLTHAILNSKLNATLKHRGAVDTLLVFQYKVLTSKLSKDFKFNANRELMTTVYASLSKKFSIKQYGSWGALLNARAEDVISKGSIHYNTLMNFDNDLKIQYIATDMQGRLRDIVKNHWDVINSIRESDKKIMTTSATIDTDDGAAVVDMSRSIVVYKDYINSVVGERTNFIKDELIKVIASAMTTMSPVFLRDALEHVSDNYQLDGGEIEGIINGIMVHAFDFLSHRYQGNMRTPDLAYIVTTLRGIYMSSRTKDMLLLKLRDDIDAMLKRKLRGRSEAAIAAVRTGLMLYVVVRALTKKHYSA